MEQKSYTKKELRVLMEATGYPMASIEKTMRLLELLRAINEDAFLSENLTLKGGTAINIIHYSELPRLSVDLDFDLAKNTPKEEMLAVKDEVSERIRGLIRIPMTMKRIPLTILPSPISEMPMKTGPHINRSERTSAMLPST